MRFDYFVQDTKENGPTRFVCGVLNTNVTGYGSTQDEAINNGIEKVKNHAYFKDKKGWGSFEINFPLQPD